MKLVFYSGGDAEDNKKLDEKLLSLSTKKSLTIAFIPSCSYFSETEYDDFIDQYKKLGIQKILKLNIDQPFSELMRRAIFLSDIIHLGGGNTFYFLKHLRRTGMLKELREWVKGGGILSGLSAGAIMMTPNVETASFPSFDRDDNEDNVKNLKALNLVDFDFFPHYKNSKRYDEELAAFSLTSQRPMYAPVDGAGIIVNDNELSFVGKTACFFMGQKYFIQK